MMAILLGVEFFLVFDRTTNSYEQKLRDGYAMFVVTKKPIELKEFQKLNNHINESQEVNKDKLSEQISQGISQSNAIEILKALPYFYNVKLDGYHNSGVLKEIKTDLEKSENIKRVETFGSSYSDSYKLFTFIKFILKAFISFMAIISLLLIIKQMEIWRYAHKERMQVMKIFGASLMLRSGVLFRVAFVDALISAFSTSGIFLLLKYRWAADSHIEILSQKQNLLFQSSDFIILIGISMLIVTISVSIVVFGNED